MSTTFPTALDTYSTKVDGTDYPQASHINNPQDAILALEAKVGINGSAVTTSHDYLLTTKANTASPTFTGTVTIPTLSVTGNSTIGDSSGDTLTINPSAVTWANNPTHSGNHTFSGTAGIRGVVTVGPVSAGDGGSIILTRPSDGAGAWRVESYNSIDFRIYNVSGASDVFRATSNGNVTIPAAASGISLEVAGSSPLQIANAASLYAKNSGGTGQVWFTFTSGNVQRFGDYSGSYASELAGTTVSLKYGASALEGFGLKSDGRLFAKAIHNNGTVTGTTDQFLASGSYTPTLTNVANATSLSVVGTWKWIRLGNVVHVVGQFTHGASSVNILTQIGASLPIASNLASSGDLSGAWNSYNATAGAGRYVVKGDTTNDRAQFDCVVGDTGTTTASVAFSYEIY